MSLQNRHIVLGLSGGVAAYKCCELVRLLRGQGARVSVVMTQAAERFVGSATLQALSGEAVHTDLWDRSVPDSMGHISLTRTADALVIAPASADILARLAAGVADDLLTTLALARPADRCPLLVAPAMNVEMWQAAATQRNAACLRGDGVHFAGPAVGAQACGETGAGRMLEASELLAAIEALLAKGGRLSGRHLLITAGPTFEPIDPVRGITNRSSGKMGYALAQAARMAGARVTLVSGPVALPAPAGVERVSVTTAAQMLAAVLARASEADVFVGVAAVADWRAHAVAGSKIRKGPDAAPPALELVPNEDILARVAALPDGPLCVGFAAETEDLAARARAKRVRKGVAMIVGNLAQDSLEADSAELLLVDAQGERSLPRASKLEQAQRLVGEIGRLLEEAAR
jgi:phosphopantothenoylcysteine decarboxylase/phosphopantothenate--cysteine ligase